MGIIHLYEEDELIYLTKQEKAFLYQMFFTDKKHKKKYLLGKYGYDLFTRITSLKYIF